jgi:hypothetical protein
LDNDIPPAHRAGMRTAHLRRGPWGYLHARRSERSVADLQVDSLAELATAWTDNAWTAGQCRSGSTGEPPSRAQAQPERQPYAVVAESLRPPATTRTVQTRTGERHRADQHNRTVPTFAISMRKLAPPSS